MSKKSEKVSKKSDKKEQKDWPVVVYMWAVGLGILGYLILGEAVFEARSHPIHWLSGLIGAVVGIGIGWLWYHWRGDVI